MCVVIVTRSLFRIDTKGALVDCIGDVFFGARAIFYSCVIGVGSKVDW